MNRPTLLSSLHTCWTAKGESCKHISPLLPTHLQRLALCCSLPPEVRVLLRARDAYFLNTFLSLTRCAAHYLRRYKFYVGLVMRTSLILSFPSPAGTFPRPRQVTFWTCWPSLHRHTWNGKSWSSARSGCSPWFKKLWQSSRFPTCCTECPTYRHIVFKKNTRGQLMPCTQTDPQL